MVTVPACPELGGGPLGGGLSGGTTPDRIQKPHPSRRREERVRKMNGTSRIDIVRGAHFLRLFRTLARRRVSFIGVIEAGWRSLGSPGNPIFLQAWTDVNGEEVPDFFAFLEPKRDSSI
jgi:hypothetical protein